MFGQTHFSSVKWAEMGQDYSMSGLKLGAGLVLLVCTVPMVIYTTNYSNNKALLGSFAVTNCTNRIRYNYN